MTHSRPTLNRGGLALIALLLASVAQAESFSKGALIIPMNSSFQTPLGQLSSYGLLYRIMEANLPGHLNASHPVTIYIINNPSKIAPNRCKPTNNAVLHTSVPNQTALADKTAWAFDGCDFTITNTIRQPVVPIDLSANTPIPAAGSTYPDAAITTYSGTFTQANAWPIYNWTNISLTTAGGFTDVNYFGVPFVIDAPDAPAVLDLLKNGDSGATPLPKEATDVFRPSTGTCGDNAALPAPGSVTSPSGLYTISKGCHFVDIHQATANFTAPVERSMNLPPPPLAVFDPAGVLVNYIMMAGLWLDGTTNGLDSRGCPSGNVSGCAFNGGKRGFVYDDFQAADVIDSTLNVNDPLTKKPAYQLVWLPHWEPPGTEANVLNAVVKFNSNRGNVLLNCASILTFQNAVNGVGGTVASRFLLTSNVVKATSNTFVGKNCSDPGALATCTTLPKPANLFGQFGDWVYSRRGGTINSYKPSSGLVTEWQPWTLRLAEASDGWDDYSIGQKNSSTGVVAYVGGHDVSDRISGARIVLNTMLNLSASTITSERDVAAPVIAYGNSPNTPTFPDQMLTATFDAVSGYSTNPAVKRLDATSASSAKQWVWPYYPGHFRAHDMTTQNAGVSAYDDNLSWDATNLSTTKGISPSPGSRNLFTWLGGYPAAGAAMSGGRMAPHNVMQIGWVPEAIDGTILDLTGACPPSTSKCVDVMGIAGSSRTTLPVYDDGQPGFHLVRTLTGASDGLCDLAELQNVAKINSGADWGNGNAQCTPNNIKRFLDAHPMEAWLFQRVRGYCFTGNVVNPSAAELTPTLDTSCTANIDVPGSVDNVAHLGGLVRSTPAVVGPSAKIRDSGAPRPTVAYVGGWDGQLHAIYVGGGSRYTGPCRPQGNDCLLPLRFNEDNSPLSKFKHPWDAEFAVGTTPAAGSELWSFLPGSQLPHLDDNSAKVDAPPAVMDVFADFAGTGEREWHTVLVGSVGGEGAELFALDVTNPLNPRLLWNAVGSLVGTPTFSPTLVLNNTLNTSLPGTTDAVKWVQTEPGTTTSTSSLTKVYDYASLGGSTGVSMAFARLGLQPVYMAYVATNMVGGASGIEVFAIDVSTGQKVWQWEHQYTGTIPYANAAPPPPSVLSGSGGATSVLVGDAQGRVWELDAVSGANVNVSSTLPGCSATSPCSYAAFDVVSLTGTPQPITTNIAVAVVPTTIAANKALSDFKGTRVLIFGTAGADWIGAGVSTDPGALHVVLYDSSRLPLIGTASSFKLLSGTMLATGADIGTYMTLHGVLQEPAPYPNVFPPGERLYGNITVAGSVAYVPTAMGPIGDIMALKATVGGHLYALDLSVSATGAVVASLPHGQATFGGVAAYISGGALQGVAAAGVSKVNFITSLGTTTQANSAPKPALNVSGNGGVGVRIMSWMKRFLSQ